MAPHKIQGNFKVSSGLPSRSIHSDFSLFIPSCSSHLTEPLWGSRTHVHHLLQPVQGQPTSLALLCSDSSYGTCFLQWQIHKVMHILRSWAYHTVTIVYMLCQLLPSIRNHHCGILDGKCLSQVFDHHLAIFGFLNKPVEYFPSVVSLETPLFLGYLEDGGRKLLWNVTNYSPVNPTMEPQVMHQKYHF